MQELNVEGLNKTFGIDGPSVIILNESDYTEITTPGPMPEAIKQAISQSKMGSTPWMKGKKHRPDSIAQMVANLPDRKGSNNPRSSTWRIEFEDGRVVVTKSLQTWAVDNGYPPTSVRNLYNGRGVKNYKGMVKVEKLNNTQDQEAR